MDIAVKGLCFRFELILATIDVGGAGTVGYGGVGLNN